jgi:uncharacterized protein (TIGR02678 family)
VSAPETVTVLPSPAEPEPDQRPGPASVQERQQAAERRRALRALLRNPLLTPDGADPDGFALVRRHARELRDWFARHPGWSLHVDADHARLRKTPADLADATRPARARRADPPFTRRRYALACLALAALERTDRQTTLGDLAEQVMALVGGDPALAEAGMAFDLSGRDQRRDLVAVVRLLLGVGLLTRVDGDEEAYLAQRGDALYTIHRPVLAAMLALRRGPSTVDAGGLDARLAAISEEPLPETDEGRRRRLRTRLVRRLLDDPVVYYDELDDAELDYLHRSRAKLLDELCAATGLVAEIRREGIALVDERGDATDLGLPEEGTDGHVTLLVAEHLADHARTAPGTPLPRSALHRHVAGLIATHHRHWRKGVAEPGADAVLADDTVERLAALRLVRVVDDGVVPLPAIARYALEPQPATLTDQELP